jgi:hypothetical protein
MDPRSTMPTRRHMMKTTEREKIITNKERTPNKKEKEKARGKHESDQAGGTTPPLPSSLPSVFCCCDTSG